VIKIKTEAADLQEFSSALMLPGVDAGIEHVENLVVAGENGARENLRIAAVNARFHGLGRDHDGGFEYLDLRRIAIGCGGSASLPCWGQAAKASRISVFGVFITMLRIYKS
jgi:hypothetical protein